MFPLLKFNYSVLILSTDHTYVSAKERKHWFCIVSFMLPFDYSVIDYLLFVKLITAVVGDKQS